MDKQKLITLVQNAQTGDPDALSELFAAYRNEVYSIAMQHTKNRTLSDDIVQETFLEVIQTIGSLEHPAAFTAWLKTLAYHQCTRYYKKKEAIHEVSAYENEDGFSVLDTLEETNAEFIPDAAVDQAEFRATILGMVDALPDAQRAALQMFYYEQMPLKVIAQVQGVSVNTANTRLNRGRLAVKNSVEDYEKKHGIRLHTIAFFPFFRWLFRGTRQVMPEESAALVAENIAAKTGVELCGKTGLSVSAAAGAAPTAPAAVTAKAAAGAKAISTGLATKIIAGVAAVSLAVGGMTVYQAKVEKPEGTSVVEVQDDITIAEPLPENAAPEEAGVSQPENSPVREAYACYEEFLRSGIAQNGFTISHYAYVDLDQDGIPELIAADNTGTEDTMTECEVFAFRNHTLTYCGRTGAYYELLYYVNHKYVRGCNRLGPQFVSLDESFRTSIYHWDEARTRNDPAISYDGENWEYITQEEFEFYNSLTGGFVTSAEVITFQENTFRVNALGQFLDTSKAWTYSEETNDGTICFTFVFEDDGKFYSLLGQPYSEYFGFYCGQYNVTEDRITLTMEVNENINTSIYCMDENNRWTQISDEGIFTTHTPGTVLHLQEEIWKTKEELKSIALAYLGSSPPIDQV